jgi:hypothetical protein
MSDTFLFADGWWLLLPLFFFPHQLHGDCMTITGKTIEENVTDSFAAYDALKKIPLGENASTSGRESPLTHTIVSCFSSGCYLYFCVRDYYYIFVSGTTIYFLCQMDCSLLNQCHL